MQNLVSWNAANFITVNVMAVAGFAAIGLVAQLVRSRMNKGA